MDEKRQGEIAIKVVKWQMRREGKFPINKKSFRREIGMMAKEIGISIEEMLEFAKPLLKEALDECFTPSTGKSEDQG